MKGAPPSFVRAPSTRASASSKDVGSSTWRNVSVHVLLLTSLGRAPTTAWTHAGSRFPGFHRFISYLSADRRRVTMNSCEMIERCIFFNDKMHDYPFAAEQMKKTLCLGDNGTCARHMVLDALGKDPFPRPVPQRRCSRRTRDRRLRPPLHRLREPDAHYGFTRSLRPPAGLAAGPRAIQPRPLHGAVARSNELAARLPKTVRSCQHTIAGRACTGASRHVVPETPWRRAS